MRGLGDWEERSELNDWSPSGWQALGRRHQQPALRCAHPPTLTHTATWCGHCQCSSICIASRWMTIMTTVNMLRRAGGGVGGGWATVITMVGMLCHKASAHAA